MHDYTQLDAAIVAQIKAGCGSFTAMSAALSEAAKSFVQDPRKPRACPAPTWRVVDRRLQALRKRNAITYSRADGRWHAALKPTVEATWAPCATGNDTNE